MTIKKAYRLEKEIPYKKVNSSPTSVCCGVHHIINQKKYEECKKCKLCPKYIEYKRQGRKDSGDVKFRYTESFRECELYKEDMGPVIDKEPKRGITPKSNHGNLITIKKKSEVEAEAYIRLAKNKPQLLDYLTWTECFSIICMQYVVEEMNKEIRKSEIFKGKIKFEYNKFWNHYILYRGYVRDLCFRMGDESVVKKFSNGISIHFLKLRISIENYINRFNVKHSKEMAHILTGLEMIGFVKDIHNENIYNMHLHEPNASFSEKLCPNSLLNDIYFITSLLQKADGQNIEIHLNHDINIVNGVNVIKNKIRDSHIISEIIYGINQYHEQLNNSKK